MEVKPTKDFLDPELAKTFRKVINSSPIFLEAKEQNHRYNLICTVMDRLDSAVLFLNTHEEPPKTEEDLVCFLVYACIARDAVYKLYQSIFQRRPSTINDKRFVLSVLTHSKRAFAENTQPTDDVFFDYLRSMAFAHPFDTSKRRRAERTFMMDGEIQYCPFVIIPHNPSISGPGNYIGIRVYSNEPSHDLKDFYYPFEALKLYVKERYDCIHELIRWAEDEISCQEEVWRMRSVNRNQAPVDVLQEIHDILEERFHQTYDIDQTRMFLSCDLSDIDKNKDSVSVFRAAIIDVLPRLCDCVDSLDYDGLFDVLSTFNRYPYKMHPMAFYQLEKIATYLDKRSSIVARGSNEAWGLFNAEEFAKEFAQKWVDIDVANMEYDEIKLLVATACYLEAKEQEANKERLC